MRLHLMQFTDEQEAIDDPTIGQYYMPPDIPPEDPDYLPGTWQGGNIMTDESVWSNDVPVSGWWMIIASVNSNTALAEHLSCRIAWENETAVVLGGTYTGNEIALIAVAPVPAGSYNPWPNVPPTE